MMWDGDGVRRGVCRRGRPLVRSCQRVPIWRQASLRVWEDGWWCQYQWYPRQGYYLVAVGVGTYHVASHCQLPASWGRVMALVRREGSVQGGIVAALEMPLLLAKRWPAIAEFLVATQFADGTARQPGELKLSNRGAGWLLTLYDVEQACRVAVNAPTVEQGLGLLEQLLGVADAPWEHDQYLQSLLDRRKSKRKR